MARKALDSNVTDNDFRTVFDNEVARNPVINRQITDVRNSNNLYLCVVLRFYPHKDMAYVKLLDGGKRYFCYLSHEMLSNEVSLNVLCQGTVKSNVEDGTYIEPYSKIYAVMGEVRWTGTTDERVLLGCVNYKSDKSLMSGVNTGEIKLKVGDNYISITKDWINIYTDNLYVNGLPYNKPELGNYYNKDETSIMVSSLSEGLENTNNGEVERHSFTTLQTIIDKASENSVLKLNGEYKYDEEVDSELVTGITINKNITIIGGQYLSINGDGKARCLIIDGDVALENLTVKNGYCNGAGAGIYVKPNHTINVKNINFLNNRCEDSTGAGLFLKNKAIATVRDCVFDGNVATRVSDLPWEEHKTGMGGAIYCGYGGGLNIYNTNFRGNNSYVASLLVVSYNDTVGRQQSKLYIENSTFEDNTTENSSIIYVDEYGFANIMGCNFNNNKSTNGHGTINAESCTTLNIKNCNFTENTGGKGACIRITPFANGDENKVDVSNCNFIENNGSTCGGIYLNKTTGATISNCTFNNNTGGAIMSNGTCSGIQVVNSSFLTVSDTHSLANGSVFSNCYTKT